MTQLSVERSAGVGVAPMNFIGDVAEQFRADLNAAGFALRPNRDERALTADRIGILYFTAARNGIQPQPRRVHWSPLARSADPPPDARRALERIRFALQWGHNVNAHLSKGWKKSEHDAALYVLGTHHLHLTLPDSRGVVPRAGDWLLLVIVRPSDVYFVDVRSHREDFVQLEPIRQAARRWPHLFYFAPGASAVDGNGGDQRVIRFMKAGINTALEIDGKVVFGGFGLMGNGDSAEVRRAWNHLCARLRLAEQACAADAVRLAGAAEQQRGEPVPELVFKASYAGGKISVTECTSGLTIAVNE